MMRQMKMFFLVGVLGLVVAAPASADWLFGVKTGPMVIDSNGYSDTTNTGVVVGYEIGAVVADLALEAEFTTSTSDGKSESQNVSQNVSLDTQALYLAFRTAGPFYFKAKAGYVNEDLKVGNTSYSDTGLSYGVGLGLGLGLAQLELELTTIDTDIVFISVGAQF
ncbi:MAG: outer membrane beta-barrel protein [Gammaproteobacteria bacterium]|nr:outer membrane beta-barrel protein [Gammaproteobacteria bacterium]